MNKTSLPNLYLFNEFSHRKVRSSGKTGHKLCGNSDNLLLKFTSDVASLCYTRYVSKVGTHQSLFAKQLETLWGLLEHNEMKNQNVYKCVETDDCSWSLVAIEATYPLVNLVLRVRFLVSISGNIQISKRYTTTEIYMLHRL